MNNNFTNIPLGKFLSQVERFETRQELEEYHFAGTYSFGRGVFAGDIKLGSTFRLDRVQRVHEGDFVYCKIMAWEGAFGIVPEEAHNCVMSGAFIAYEINSKIIDSKYLSYYFRVESAWKRIASQSTGTNIRRQSLHPKNFEKSTIPLPPLEEQRRIVERIEELAGKIAEARGLRERSIKKSQSFVTSLHLSLSESRIIKLSEIFTLHEIQEKIIPAKKYPQVGVKGFGGGLFAKESIDSTQTTYKNFNHLYQGALVLSQVKGWEGAVAVCPPNLVGKYVSPEYRTFRCIPEQAIPEYIATLVANPWFWEKLKDLTRGMGGRRERIRPEQFLSLEIPMPTIDKQYKALKILKKLQECIPIRQKALKELDVILPAILNKAFKGEL